MFKREIKKLTGKKSQILKGILLLFLLTLLVPYMVLKASFIISIGLCLMELVKINKKIEYIRVAERDKKNIDKLNKLRKECIKKINFIEYIFNSHGFSTNTGENYMVDELYEIFNCHCNTVKAYTYFLSELDRKIQFTLNYVRTHNEKSYKDNTNGSSSYSEDKISVKDKLSIELCLQTLGLNKDVRDMNVIKKAYRGLAKSYHPDLNKSVQAEAKFRFINEAYQRLQDLLVKKAI